jgi:probable F420-dependent oxidoreductase
MAGGDDEKMKIDGGIQDDLATAPSRAKLLEDAGYDGVFAAELKHDPFFPALTAALATNRVEVGTGIAVAFARNPMTLANIGYDLQLHSQGRFILGLGSQIKPHITKRFSMPWSSPAARMREMVQAIRAIWDCWNDGTTLDFRGEFYTHVLMTPMFDPGPNPYGNAKIFLAGVGPKMTEVAGEVADGFIAHGFTTPEYFREVSLPAIEKGLGLQGRARGDFEISMPLFLALEDGDDAIGRTQPLRKQLAFYGSTPAYRPVLDHHGWGELQPELNAMSKQGRWDDMAELIDDDMVDAFAVRTSAKNMAAAIAERYEGLLDRIQFFAPIEEDPDTWRPVLEAIREI